MAIGAFVRRRWRRRSAGSLAVAIVASSIGCFAGPSPAPSGNAGAPSPTATSGAKATPLDLATVGNVAIADYEGIPTGEQELGGVAFRIGDSAVRVGSRSFPDFPRGVTGIPVGRSFRVARFLHATNGGTYQQPGHPKHEFDGVHVGDYVIRYEDGTSETFQLRYGHELRDWWNWDGSLPVTNATVVWTGENPGAAKYDVEVRLYATSWLNPHPDKQVARIDLVSANAKAAPFCAAITVDDDPSFMPPESAAPPTSPSSAGLAMTPQHAGESALSAPSEREIERRAAGASERPAFETSPTVVPQVESPRPEPRVETPAAADEVAPAPAPESVVASTPDSKTIESPAEDPVESAPAETAQEPSEAGPGGFADLLGPPDDDDSSTAEEEPLDFLGPPPERWDVAVDAAAAIPAYADPLPYEGLAIRPRRIIAPAIPSPFIATMEGEVDIEGFRSIDLRSGAEIASVGGIISRSRSSYRSVRPCRRRER